LKTLFVLSGILFIAGFVPYIISILHKETKPAKASWIIWVALDTITFAGMLVKETANGQIIGAVIGGWLTVILALKYGISGWSKLDKFCLGGAILGIVLWQTFDDPVLGILTSQGATFLGSIPTFLSAWKDPSRENKFAWTIFFASCVCAVIAIPHWTLADATQPITFFVVESTMMYILFIQPLVKRRSKKAIQSSL